MSCYIHVLGTSSDEKSSLSVQLLQRLVYTAAKVDAFWLIQIIFNLPSGEIAFNSYKSRSLLPEDVAIAHGHKETAQYLKDVTKRYKFVKLLLWSYRKLSDRKLNLIVSDSKNAMQ